MERHHVPDTGSTEQHGSANVDESGGLFFFWVEHLHLYSYHAQTCPTPKKRDWVSDHARSRARARAGVTGTGAGAGGAQVGGGEGGGEKGK